MKIYPVVLQILRGNENLTLIKCQSSSRAITLLQIFWKIKGKNQYLDLVNIDVNTKFGPILSIGSQDICFVCLFGLILYFPVNSFGHVEMVSSPNHFFLSKLVLRAHTFSCNLQKPFLNQRKGGEWP